MVLAVFCFIEEVQLVFVQNISLLFTGLAVLCSLGISTTLDCQHKFRNFWGSTWAIRRMNDKLCLEHGLSIVEDPKPSRDHYGTWLGNQKQPSHQEQIRWAIDAALAEKPN